MSTVTTSTGRNLPFDPALLTATRLLEIPLENPEVLLQARDRFYGYSIMNRIAAIVQCIDRGLPPGPLASYRTWQDLDRQVRRGEKALVVLHPVYGKRMNEETGKEESVLTGFTWKPTVWTLAQTDGEELELAERVPFDLPATLERLGITLEPFAHPDGNAFGYARGRTVAVSPLSPRPERTLLHEIGHVLLGHTAKQERVDGSDASYSTGEVEAEAFSYLVCGYLGLGQETAQVSDSRAYIQSWLARAGKADWSDWNSRHVLTTVDRFLDLTRKLPSSTVAEA